MTDDDLPFMNWNIPMTDDDDSYGVNLAEWVGWLEASLVLSRSRESRKILAEYVERFGNLRYASMPRDSITR